MRIKEIIKLLTLLMLFLMPVCGCELNVSKNENVISKKYGTDYEEYFDYMQTRLNCLSVGAYYENADGIKLFLSDKKNYDFDVSFADALDTHNAFTDANGSYFSKDMKIVYAEENAGNIYQFSNKPDFFGISEDSKEIIIQNNNQFTYCLVNFSKITNSWNCPAGDYRDNIKVIAVDVTKSGAKGSKLIPSDFSFLSDFSNLEKVVFLTDWEYDENESFYDEVIKNYPNLEIYTSSYRGPLIKKQK